MQHLSAGMVAVECPVDECRYSFGCCEFTQGNGPKKYESAELDGMCVKKTALAT